MTQRDQSVTQLTLDGREVPHPPPRPRVTCRECHKTVTLTNAGEYHKHNIYDYQVCPNSGKRFER